jgi:hypothetical protein
MKPVIITLNSDGKVVMSVEEFKRHMDEAYNQGYTDGTAASTTITYPYNSNKWWYGVSSITTANTLTTDSINGACDCVAGVCDCNTECTNQVSISDYIKNKGE